MGVILTMEIRQGSKTGPLGALGREISSSRWDGYGWEWIGPGTGPSTMVDQSAWFSSDSGSRGL